MDIIIAPLQLGGRLLTKAHKISTTLTLQPKDEDLKLKPRSKQVQRKIEKNNKPQDKEEMQISRFLQWIFFWSSC